MKDKRLFRYLAAAVLFWLYFSVFLRPNINKISDLKRQGLQARKQLDALTAQFPEPSKAREELKNFNKGLLELGSRTKEIESQMLGASSAPALLRELIKNAQGKKIDFQTVKQNIEPDKSGFSRLSIELEFDSTYRDTLVYLASIERISPFVKVEGIELAQAKSDPANLASVSVKLSALLSPAGQEAAGLSSEAGQPAARPIALLKRSPLTPAIKTAKAKKIKKLELTGITYRKAPGASSAIINGAVVKAGDQIEGYKIEGISPESVTITDGTQSDNLSVER